MDTEDPANNTVELPNVVVAFTLEWEHRSYGDAKDGIVRCNDGARFYYDLQRRYYAEMRDHLRSIGVRVPITACVTPHVAPDLKAVADELDFVSNGTYYDHPHLSVRVGGREDEGYFGPNSVELQNVDGVVARLALGKISGKPMIAREWNMPFPNEYRSQAMLQAAAYACLQDWDGLLFYGLGGSLLQHRNVLQSFTCYTDPEHWCQFSVAALLFHRRDVRTAEELVHIGHSDTDTFGAWASHQHSPSKYTGYVCRTEQAYFERRYEGRADLTVSSGASSQGNYASAKRCMVWAHSPSADLQLKLVAREHLLEGLDDVDCEDQRVPVLHLPHGFGTEQIRFDGFGFDHVGLFADRLPAIRIASLPPDAEPVGSDGTWCLGYLTQRRLVMPHLTSVSKTMRAPEQHVLGRFVLDALNRLGVSTTVSHRDLDAHSLRSTTGELCRDIGRGVFTIETPLMQAASGLIGGESIELDNLVAEIVDDNAVVSLTSLDENEIGESRELLLVVIGKARNTDQYRNASVVHPGFEPVLYRPASGGVKIRLLGDSSGLQVRVLGPSGDELTVLDGIRSDQDEITIPLYTEGPSVYYHIQR